MSSENKIETFSDDIENNAILDHCSIFTPDTDHLVRALYRESIERAKNRQENLSVEILLPEHSYHWISEVYFALAEGSTLVLDHLLDQKDFEMSLRTNKPNKVIAPKGYWLDMFDEMEKNKKCTKFRHLTMPVVALEPLSPGEEKYLNRMLRKCKAGTISAIDGTDKLGLIFKSKREGLFKKSPQSYETSELVKATVLNNYGTRCNPNEIGSVVVSSPSLLPYLGPEPDACEDLIAEPYGGMCWYKTNKCGLLDLNGELQIKGETTDFDVDIEKYMIDIVRYTIKDIIAKDTKRIRSVEVVTLENGTHVAHVRMQPNVKRQMREDVLSIIQRLATVLPRDITDTIVYRVLYDGGMPLIDGKVDYQRLHKLAYDDTYNFDPNGRLCDGLYYINRLNEIKSRYVLKPSGF